MNSTPLSRLPAIKPWWGVGVVLAATLAAFGPAFQAGFINLDDYRYLTAVRPFDLPKIWFIFTHFFEGYHPLTLVTLGLTFRLAEFNPWLHHAVNVLLHLINTALVYVFLARLLGNRGLAWLACAIFGLHPVHVEAVVWITSRKDVLYATFYLLALWQYVIYLERPNRTRYLGLLGLFVLAVLSKGMAVSLPLALIAVDVVRKRQLCTQRVWLEKLPFFALSLVFGWISIRAQQASGYVPELGGAGGLWARAGLALRALALYAWHLVDFTRLAAFHPYPSGADARALTVAGALLLVVFAAVIIVDWRRSRVFAFAALFFLATIGLVLQFVPVADFVVADRYDYVSSIGFCIAVATIVARACTHRAGRLLALPLVMVYTVILAFSTRTYAGAWHDSVAIWTQALRQYPAAAFPRNMRGCAYNDLGRYAEAVTDFDLAVQADPHYPRTYLNRGFAHDKLGDSAGALQDYAAFIQREPDDPLGYNNQGLILALGNSTEALASFDNAIARGATHPAAHLFYGNRAETRLALGDVAGAKADATVALSRFPRHYRAYLTRAEAEWRLGEHDAAEADVAQAEAIDPQDPAAAALRAKWLGEQSFPGGPAATRDENTGGVAPAPPSSPQ